MKVKANVLLGKCYNDEMYGMRVQYDKGDWWRTWAFRIKEELASKEGFDKTVLSGNFYYAEGYPGCPYCGKTAFFVCGNCKKINCWHGESYVTCMWCKVKSGPVTEAEILDVTGGGY